MSGWSIGGGDWTSDAAPIAFNTQDKWNGDSTVAGSDWNEKSAADAFQDDDIHPAGDASIVAGDRLCFRCEQPGHNKAECTNGAVHRPFQGTCRTCNEEGHMSKDCPNRVKICRQCGQEGHETIECTNNKIIDMTNVPDMTEHEAWELMREASDDLDVGDFKDALKALSKARPSLTYADIEKELRQRRLLIYLVALKKDVDPAYTNTNLQGEVGKTYTLGVFTRSHACPRPVLMEAWPKDSEDNMKRLDDAGVPLERGVPVCANCGKIGHMRKACMEESTAPEKKGPTCVLCDEEGHYARDCPSERKSAKPKRTCRFCESEDHLAAECPDKPAQKPIECRNCLQEGHRAADCVNERVMKCRNCEETGHVSRDCPQPKNWDKVQCRHCGAMGHASEARCDPTTKAAFAAAQAEKNGDAGGFDETATTKGGDGGWDNSGNGFSNTGGSSWDSPAPAITAGGW